MSMEFVPLHIQNTVIARDAEKFMYGIDAVLLADFASGCIKKNKSVMDLCTGNAIVPVLLSRMAEEKNVVLNFSALEIQKEVFLLGQKSVEKNNIKNIKLFNMDLKNVHEFFLPKSFEYVTCNPPYIKKDCGDMNKNDFITGARKEIFCNLEDVIKASGYLLKSNGSLFLIHRPDRFAELCVLLDKYKFAPSRIRFVVPCKNKAPTMVLVEAKKDAMPQLKVEPFLCVYDSKNEYTEEMNKIYRRH